MAFAAFIAAIYELIGIPKEIDVKNRSYSSIWFVGLVNKLATSESPSVG